MDADKARWELVEEVWSEWKERVIKAVEAGIGKKKITEKSKRWWSRDIEEATNHRREACRNL